MWKKGDRIAIVLIIVMMAMQLSLFKIFANIIPIFNYSYNTPLLCTVYVLMEVAISCFVLIPRIINGKSVIEGIKALWNNYYYVILMLFILVLAIVMTDIVTVANDRLRVTNILTHNLDYMYAFLALPITILLVEKKWEWQNFVDTILYLASLSMLLRIYVMVYYSLTGVEIECISLESSLEGWIRDGRLRIMPPCLIMLIAPLAIYSFASAKRFLKKIIYLAITLLSLFYVFYVWQSRAAILYIGVGIGVMVMFGVTSKRLNIIRWSLAGVGTIGVLVAGGARILIQLFSTNSEASGFAAENRGHYYAYDIFWGHFKQNILYGSGMNEGMNLRNSMLSAEQRFIEQGFLKMAEDGSYLWFIDSWVKDSLEERYQWLCDTGILYSLEPMGLLIGIFFILMFSRGIYIYLRDRKNRYIAVLPLALIATVMVCEISIDCFFTPIAFAVPFLISIVEYVSNAQDSLYNSTLQ